MIEVVYRKCQKLGCFHRCCLNYPEGSVPTFCQQHMIKNEATDNDDTSFRAMLRHAQIECSILPTLNLESVNDDTKEIKEINNIFDHQEDTLKCQEQQVLCILPGCQEVPCWNFEGAEKPVYCDFHKLDSMVEFPIDSKTGYAPGESLVFV
mmetsp:Transcript_28455/g.36938  ORF Transcript_28455/g.36938 Transcript_28455/m.36938 type:complete len:151 (-) Transcript_28455:27-479(-)